MKATILRAVNEAMFFAQPAVLSGLVFTTYRLLGNVLTPEKVCFTRWTDHDLDHLSI